MREVVILGVGMRDDIADQVLAAVKESMQEALERIVPEVPFMAEIRVAEAWVRDPPYGRYRQLIGSGFPASGRYPPSGIASKLITYVDENPSKSALAVLASLLHIGRKLVRCES